MKENVEIPKDILIGIYRIMCGVPSSLGNTEVYKEAIPGMQMARHWVLKYGSDQDIDMRGIEEHKNRNM